jgi:hypothetical protein
VRAALSRYEKQGKKLHLKEGAVGCDIITQDWLDESIAKKRALPVKKFLLSTIESQVRKAKRDAKKAAMQPGTTHTPSPLPLPLMVHILGFSSGGR